MGKLKQEVSVGELFTALQTGSGFKLVGHRLHDIEFHIGRKSDGFNDRDSVPGGIPYVDGITLIWVSEE